MSNPFSLEVKLKVVMVLSIYSGFPEDLQMNARFHPLLNQAITHFTKGSTQRSHIYKKEKKKTMWKI